MLLYNKMMQFGITVINCIIKTFKRRSKMKTNLILLIVTIVILVLTTTTSAMVAATIDFPSLAATSYISLYRFIINSYVITARHDMTDFAGNEYILFQYMANPISGYVVMFVNPDKPEDDCYDFVELVEGEMSPFVYFNTNNITGDKKYAGPGNYFIQSGNIIYPLTGNTFTIDDPIYNMYYQISLNLGNSLRLEEEPMNEDGYTYIDDYQYFMNLKNHNGYVIPHNNEGTCGFNALAILLGYYNIYEDPNLLSANSGFMEAVKDTVLTMQDFDLNTISIDNIRPIPTVSDHLVTTLTEYIYPQYQQKTGKIFGGYPSDGFMLANVLDQFFDDYLTPQEREKYEFSGSLYTSYFVKNEIDNNRPVILSMLVYYMYNYDANGNLLSEQLCFGHNVIAYGYKNNVFRVFDVNSNGYKSISKYLLGDCMVLQYNGTHTHTDYMRFYNRGSYGTFCPCGAHTVCNHDSIDPGNNCLCSSCGMHAHNYTFNTVGITSSYHQCVCTNCSHSYIEQHTFRAMNGINYCIYCGYVTDEPGIPVIFNL